ncbi:conserved hypothetical protein [Roseibium sp. TrichSKD4]|nr:conserved hypothetical protein [Roseibium sp. TrichSKD4]
MNGVISAGIDPLNIFGFLGSFIWIFNWYQPAQTILSRRTIGNG